MSVWAFASGRGDWRGSPREAEREPGASPRSQWVSVQGVPLRQRGPNRPREEEPGVQRRASGPGSHPGALSALRPQTWRGSQGLVSPGCPPQASFLSASASERRRWARQLSRRVGGLGSEAPQENRHSFCASATLRPGGAGPGRVGAESSPGPASTSSREQPSAGHPGYSRVFRRAALETLGWRWAQLPLRVCLSVFVSVSVSVWLSPSLPPLLELSLWDTDIPRTLALFPWQVSGSKPEGLRYPPTDLGAWCRTHPPGMCSDWLCGAPPFLPGSHRPAPPPHLSQSLPTTFPPSASRPVG
nr:uncharacterized protein LOC116279768 [Vicugna pacos]